MLSDETGKGLLAERNWNLNRANTWKLLPEQEFLEVKKLMVEVTAR